MILVARWFEPTTLRSPKFSCESAATAIALPLRTATAIDISAPRPAGARSARRLLARVVGGIHEVHLERAHAVDLHDRRGLALREVMHLARHQGVGSGRQHRELLRVEDVAHADR